MSQTYESTDELPETLPVFPLDGVLLLPRGQLPLNIFEPRYLKMFEDSLGKGRLIGILQPLEPQDDDSHPPLAQVGCLGRITSFSETDEGRIIVSLTGVTRFRVAQELDVLTPYRQIKADYKPYESDLVSEVGSFDVNRDGVLDELRRYLDLNGMQADWEAIESSGNEALVNSLCIISPYGPQEKQAMLEAVTLGERAEILIALTEMVLAQLSQSGGSNDNSVQ